MAIRKIEALKTSLAPGARVMGLDIGEKTIGIAVSDPSLRIASSVGTIRRTRFTPDARSLIAMMEERGVGGLIIGLPVNMDGTEGPRCQAVRAFASDFLKLKETEIAFWDERMSTMAVERAMIAADRSRSRRAKVVDSAAATWILQGALDALGNR